MAAPPADGGDPDADRVYEMTGQTGSLCYMAPEVLLGCFYNQKARRQRTSVFITLNRPVPKLARAVRLCPCPSIDTWPHPLARPDPWWLCAMGSLSAANRPCGEKHGRSEPGLIV